MNPFSLLQFLPVIMVPWRPGGQPVIRNASLAGLKACGVAVIVLGLIIYFWFVKWYRAHPVWGKIIVWTAAVWCVLRLIGIIRSFCDDPYTRVKSDTDK
ncbi:MAG: hypothetical protein ACI37O_03910 [Candidatus Avelusimicrobium sp.]|uniref:hypothetical protein n=1 Tax=Candidatus Avelusimicrobium sp. TaxID=3048833 RepID=UPI003F1070DA